MGAAVALSALLAGCAASYGPQSLRPGTSLGEVTAALGPPTGRYARADGERVEYARGPFGKHTYMLDFDAQGRLLRWQQVLTESQFEAIRTGMSGDEVMVALGHPAETRPLAYQQRTLWSYRYDAPFCTWFQVGIDRQGRVVDTGYGPDPLCEDFNFGDSGK
ncbi:hypothetical protein [Piscinibacter sp. XHJ-5]|uniref:hypothetical protein n=1 Tax=Piscinibacter sp. XHJ-5 TaxID=3037797 RepID=UPI002452A13F|nr:hypothetical protein [Piscinibacter sp. XHJ-5]